MDDLCPNCAQVILEIRKAGLESSQLIIGVDFTKSNLWTGQDSFKGKSLHDCYTGGPNPYQEVLDIMGRTLEATLMNFTSSLNPNLNPNLNLT